MSNNEYNTRPTISPAARTIAAEIANDVWADCIEKFQQAVQTAKLDDAVAYEVLQNILAGIVTNALVNNCGASIPSMQQFAGEFVDTFEAHVNAVLNVSEADQSSWH